MRILYPKMEKKRTLRQKRRPKGDPNPQKGPLGDPGTQMGTVPPGVENGSEGPEWPEGRRVDHNELAWPTES